MTDRAQRATSVSRDGVSQAAALHATAPARRGDARRTGRSGRAVAWPQALERESDRRRILGWLGVGLALRLLVMPFAVTADTLAVYWRSHVIAYDGVLFSDYLVNMGAHYVHAASLRVLGPFLPSPDALWTDPWWWADSSALAPQVLRETFLRDDVFATLFVLKLPYLAAELGAGVALLALLSSARPALARRAWVFWMLSPIGVYATYLFARYEAFAVVLVVAALWCVERERAWAGALLLGLAVTMRSYPLLLLPVVGLLAVRGWRRQGLWAALALTPFALVLLTNQLLAEEVGEIARLSDFSSGATFFAYTIPVDAGGVVFLFPLAALVLYGALAGRVWGWWGDGRTAPGLGELWVWLFVLHAAMFGLATFSAHYFMWLTPFVAIALARRPGWRAVLPLHLAQVVVVLAMADLAGGPVLAVFAPLAPDLVASIPSLYEATLGAPETAARLEGLLRTVFVALMGLSVWPALVELVRPGGRQQPVA